MMEGKVVVITGGATGLGKSFAEAFAKKRASVIIGDINEKEAQKTVSELKKEGANADALFLDVSDESSTQEFARKAHALYGRIDIIINNAAIYAGINRKPFYELETKEWDLVMNVNLKGCWLTCKAFFPYMKENGGKIINISSATFMSGSPNWSHYVASKGGVIGLTRSMAREVGDFNINVNAVAPGFTLTEASLSLMENAENYGVGRGAIKRSSQAEDIVGAVSFLASKESDFITGQTIIVDGGRQFI